MSDKHLFDKAPTGGTIAVDSPHGIPAHSQDACWRGPNVSGGETLEITNTEREQWRRDFAGKLLNALVDTKLAQVQNANTVNDLNALVKGLAEQCVHWTDLLLEALEKK